MAQLALTAAAGTQAVVNNGQQQQVNPGGAPTVQGIITPTAGGGLALLAQVSQIATSNGQGRSPARTTAGCRNLFGAATMPAQSVQTKWAVLQAIERVIANQSEDEVKREFFGRRTKGDDKKADFKNELLAL
jgi:hypothetical protein